MHHGLWKVWVGLAEANRRRTSSIPIQRFQNPAFRCYGIRQNSEVGQLNEVQVTRATPAQPSAKSIAELKKGGLDEVISNADH